MSFRKATQILPAGRAVTVTVPDVELSPFKLLPSGSSHFEALVNIFEGHREAIKGGNQDSGKIKNLLMVEVPFTRLLSEDERIYLIINPLEAQDVADNGNYPGLPQNEYATSLTLNQDDGNSAEVFGSAIVLYLEKDRDFLPHPDFQCLYDNVTDDFEIAVENNLTGGILGSSEALNAERFRRVIEGYRLELKAKEGKQKDVWDHEADQPEGPLRPIYDADGTKTDAADKVNSILADMMQGNLAERLMKEMDEEDFDYRMMKNQMEDQGLRLCANCYQTSEDARVCSVCKKVYYCDAECQKKDWKKHKPRCKK